MTDIRMTGEKVSFVPLLSEMIMKQNDIAVRQLRRAARGGDLSKLVGTAGWAKGQVERSLAKIVFEPEDLAWAKDWRVRSFHLAKSNGFTPPYMERLEKAVDAAMQKAAPTVYNELPAKITAVGKPPGQPDARLTIEKTEIECAALSLARRLGRDHDSMKQMLVAEIARETGPDFQAKLYAAMKTIQDRVGRGLA
jgi:hypothetical protein